MGDLIKIAQQPNGGNQPPTGGGPQPDNGPKGPMLSIPDHVLQQAITMSPDEYGRWKQQFSLAEQKLLDEQYDSPSPTNQTNIPVPGPATVEPDRQVTPDELRTALTMSQDELGRYRASLPESARQQLDNLISNTSTRQDFDTKLEQVSPRDPIEEIGQTLTRHIMSADQKETDGLSREYDNYASASQIDTPGALNSLQAHVGRLLTDFAGKTGGENEATLKMAEELKKQLDALTPLKKSAARKAPAKKVQPPSPEEFKDLQLSPTGERLRNLFAPFNPNVLDPKTSGELRAAIAKLSPDVESSTYVEAITNLRKLAEDLRNKNAAPTGKQRSEQQRPNYNLGSRMFAAADKELSII